MTTQQLKAKLAAGGRVYGTSILAASPRWPEAVANIGFDFVFLDTEHNAVDRDRLSWSCHAYRGVGLPPIVRVPAPDPYQASMVIDGGAAGVIAPYIESPEQAKALVGAVKFKPLKGERLQAALERRETLEPELAAYLEKENAERMVLLNIESVPAIRALDRILAVPGIDVLLIGPHDLSCSLGVPEDYHHPKFSEACRTIAEKARAQGVAAGIHSFSGIDRDVQFAEMGFNFIIREADLRTFAQAAKANLQTLKKRLGEG